MLESNDAALIIGDPAMMIDRRGLHVYDLAEEWRRHTGLPFVFAFWAVRNDSACWPGGIDFKRARREGLESVERIADIYASRMGLPRGELITYLTENISYDLDEESLRGLKLYFEMASEHRLIERAKEIVFCA
jgi:chorismate dehydratase